MQSLEFDAGLTLLCVPSPRSTVVHRLVCAQLRGGRAGYWIDAGNTASTHVLYECASSPRSIDGVQIGRAFTAYQHHSLVRAVTRLADRETALIVAPNVATLYRDVDLAEWERADLLAATLSTLRALGDALECPVLVTATTGTEAPITPHADATIECVRTREGVRFEGDAPETMGYWHVGYWQTTLPYWVECCGVLERAALVDWNEPLEVLG